MFVWFLLPALSIALICYLNFKRARHITEIELKPNCLLLARPLVFIDGKKSPFYFLRYWNEIPRFMFEHGYEVFEMSLPWRDPSARLETLKKTLDEMHSQKISAHFVIDESSKDLLSTPQIQTHPAILSVYTLKHDDQDHFDVMDAAHRLWTGQKKWSSKRLDRPGLPHPTAKEILAHAILLAEKSV